MNETSRLLWDTAQSGRLLDQLPEDARPGTRAGGYAVQAGFETYSKHRRYGWKIAATSAAGQHHINVDGPIAGRLLAETVFAPGAEIPLANNRMRVCEPEFGFRFGEPLPAARSYSRAEVMDAVATLHLTLEIPDSRFTDFTKVGAPALIADNACARELVVGPAVEADWRDIDLAGHPVRAEVVKKFTRDGSGAAVLGDPREALTWLVNEVSGLGLDILEGELVTTGTCMIPLEIAPGDEVIADYGVFGRIGVRFS